MANTAATNLTKFLTTEGDRVSPDYLPIHVLMGRVLADVGAVGKNMQAPGAMGGFSYRGIEDVLAEVKPAMARHGVFCVPSVVNRVTSERPVGQSKIMFVVDLEVSWVFFGPAGDWVEARAWGCGSDMGDKATQKAMTAAFKSMLLQTFCIADSETDSEAHVVPETVRESEDPDRWFRENGWMDRRHHDDWRSVTVQTIRGLPEASRTAVKDFLEQNGWSLRGALAKAAADAVDGYLASEPETDLPAPTPDEPAPTPDVGDRAATEAEVSATWVILKGLDPESAEAALDAAGITGPTDQWFMSARTLGDLRRLQEAMDEALRRGF